MWCQKGAEDGNEHPGSKPWTATVGTAGVLRRCEQGSTAFPWSLAPAALCVQQHREELLSSACSWCQAAGWCCGMAPGVLHQQHCPILEGVYLRRPEEIPHSVAAFQSSALSWDLWWYKTSTASPFSGEPRAVPKNCLAAGTGMYS